jgi:hypothetical protein
MVGSGAAEPGRRVLDGSAWADFCDALRRAGEVVDRPRSPRTPLDRAEGYRYLSRLARLALEKFVEHADPLAPRFYQLSHETAKIGADNPDSLYQNAALSGAHEYRIRGTRGTVSYLSLSTYYGDYGRSARSGCSGALEGEEIQVDRDGTFEVLLSCRRQPGNWLPMEPDTSMLIVRQNFLDRAREQPARLAIERLGASGPPAPLSPAFLEGALDAAGRYVGATAALFADWAEGFQQHENELRELDPAVTTGAHGSPHFRFFMGYWQLAADEALLVETTPPPCAYWNFQLNNHWMESLDYRYHRIHVNRHSCRYRRDGSFRLVVAHEDPGLPNWLETAGHSAGTMTLRWVKAEHHPKPATRVVKLSELRAAGDGGSAA